MNQQQLVRGHRIGGGSSHMFRPYTYKGDQPVPVEKPKTRESAPQCDEDGCEVQAHAVGLCPKHYSAYRKAMKSDPSLRRNMSVGFTPEKCGTPAGHQRHVYWKVEPCRACRDAHNTYRNARKAEAKARKEAAK